MTRTSRSGGRGRSTWARTSGTTSRSSSGARRPAAEEATLLHWIDGAPAPPGPAGPSASDSAFREGRGCYTTGRLAAGRLHLAGAHAERLARDAARLALGPLDVRTCAAALEALARAARDVSGAALVRLQASRDATGHIHLIGSARGMGKDPAAWRAVIAPVRHAGPAPWGGAKVTSRLRLALAADAARAAGADEALLLDAEGRLVEGTRTSVVVVGQDGLACTPPLSRGGVESLARARLLQREPDLLREADVDADALRRAREIVVVNAARGARPVVALDGRPVGGGVPGPLAARLAALLEPH